ncbi:hypothetical protein J4T94_gp067 [Mycobacterium phage Krypton555]|uniref:DUF7192 domain-containing protein n=1 Tax=Mycobacterium phage Krypton555 TaxID=2015885 RepID=A0A222ZRY2_9CAUD|nr:hypothetical protein J4T94_gp067 [Mycobacterium phage Krypton555]ASR87149.1 hypothetical protein KRYPTON555_125 [Mycobacterium phage Krypton555]
MRTYRTNEDDGTKRSVVLFDSFTDLIDHNLKKDHRSAHMAENGPSFYGVENMKEADDLARKGLPRDGVQAIKIAHHKVAQVAGELHRDVYQDMYDVAGGYVDMGRYVSGEPECMVASEMIEEPGQNKIVALIMNITYNCMISAKAIKENGLAMMALVEAIETQGMQAEIWVDMNVSGYGDVKYYARTAIKLKSAGQAFDVSTFMYALTHASFLRAHIFNAMHTHEADVRRACGIHPRGGYGSCVNNAADMDDFPPYSIYIPCITHDRQAGQFVPMILKQLGLMQAS